MYLGTLKIFYASVRIQRPLVKMRGNRLWIQIIIKSPNILASKDISIHPIGSPEQRSLARKMGSNYSPKTPPKKR
jgi:hypothetical protein